MDALPPYLGGKRRLSPLIFAALSDTLPRSKWHGARFADPFCGGGAVALHAKARGFEVIASDIALRAVIPARALVANSHVRLHRGDIVALLPEPDYDYARVASEHAPGRLPVRTAEWIDRAIARARERPEPIRSLLLLVIIKLVLRLQPMSVLDASDAGAAAVGDFDRVSPRRLGHYLRARERFTADAVWRVAQRVNAGVLGGRGSASQSDAVEAIASSEADVLYLDPPYPRTTGYTQTYALLDELLGDDRLPRATPRLETLLEASEHIPRLVLSYGGPTASLAELTDLVGRFRTVRQAIEIPYPHLRSVARKEKSRDNREYLIVATV